MGRVVIFIMMRLFEKDWWFLFPIFYPRAALEAICYFMVNMYILKCWWFIESQALDEKLERTVENSRADEIVNHEMPMAQINFV